MCKLFSLILATCLLQASHGVFAQEGFGRGTNTALVRSSVLPAEEAFAFTAFIEAPDTVVLLWEIEEGYYLYRDSIAVLDDAGNKIDLGELPEATPITDEFFGDTSVYFERLIHRTALAAFSRTGNSITFTLQYQGCAKDKYCYPVQTKPVDLSLP